MAEMVPHQLAPDAAQCLLHRRYLREDIRAVAVLIHHFLQSANLSLDAPESRQVARFYFGIDPECLSRPNRRFATRAPALCSINRVGLCTLHIRLHLNSWTSQTSRTWRNLRLLVTTLTELRAIAALAIIGLSIS